MNFEKYSATISDLISTVFLFKNGFNLLELIADNLYNLWSTTNQLGSFNKVVIFLFEG